MTLLVTGIAGFIAAEVARQLLGAGREAVGVDNLNDYYDVRLKDYRLSHLFGQPRPGYALGRVVPERHVAEGPFLGRRSDALHLRNVEVRF